MGIPEFALCFLYLKLFGLGLGSEGQTGGVGVQVGVYVGVGVGVAIVVAIGVAIGVASGVDPGVATGVGLGVWVMVGVRVGWSRVGFLLALFVDPSVQLYQLG